MPSRASQKRTTKKRTTKKRTTKKRSKPAWYKHGSTATANLFELYSIALMAIASAKLKLAERKAFSESLTELDFIKAQQEQLTGEREKIIAREVAFQSMKARIRPPTKAQLASLAKVSQELDKLVASATNARAIVEFVGKVLKAAEDAAKGLKPYEA